MNSSLPLHKYHPKNNGLALNPFILRIPHGDVYFQHPYKQHTTGKTMSETNHVGMVSIPDISILLGKPRILLVSRHIFLSVSDNFWIIMTAEC